MPDENALAGNILNSEKSTRRRMTPLSSGAALKLLLTWGKGEIPPGWPSHCKPPCQAFGNHKAQVTSPIFKTQSCKEENANRCPGSFIAYQLWLLSLQEHSKGFLLLGEKGEHLRGGASLSHGNHAAPPDVWGPAGTGSSLGWVQ